MTAFSVTPVGPFPPDESGGFPKFIQFQQDGVNLGGPDADTVNFVGNLIATREPSGVDQNTIVVTIA